MQVTVSATPLDTILAKKCANAALNPLLLFFLLHFFTFYQTRVIRFINYLIRNKLKNYQFLNVYKKNSWGCQKKIRTTFSGCVATSTSCRTHSNVSYVVSQSTIYATHFILVYTIRENVCTFYSFI
jgi:hypothetical protein